MKIDTPVAAGTKFKVIGNSASHGFPMGTIVTNSSPLKKITDGSYFICYGTASNGVDTQYNVYGRDLAIAWATRKEHADFVKEEIAELDKKRIELINLHENLSKYDSDEEEVAALLVTAMDSGMPKEKKITNLAKMLKGRLKTDML